MADSSMFITIAMLLAVFNVEKAKDKFGKEIEPNCEYHGFARYEFCKPCFLVKRRPNIVLVTRRLSNARLRPAQRRQRSSSVLYYMTTRSRKEMLMYSKVSEGGVGQRWGEG